VRLYLLDELAAMDEALAHVQARLVDKAEAHLDVLMPGYTHLQPAQPLRFSHWLMSYFWMLARDRDRLADVRRRTSCCPLGAGALAGNAYGVDREALARDLGFDGVTENSMDAVSDRDMIVETLSWGALVGVHLSRLAEDLILWSSVEFGFVRLDEPLHHPAPASCRKSATPIAWSWCAADGRLTGNLMQLLTGGQGHSLPPTTRTCKRDKEPLFDTLATLGMVLPIVAGVIETLEVHPEAMRAALDDAMLATDLADYLVRRGLPFREAHHLVGQAVARSEAQGLTLRTLSLAEYQAISPHYGDDLFTVLDFEASVESRDVTGGTSRRAVQEQIDGRGRCWPDALAPIAIQTSRRRFPLGGSPAARG
jgi:argininosuccinate lyase